MLLHVSKSIFSKTGQEGNYSMTGQKSCSLFLPFEKTNTYKH